MKNNLTKIEKTFKFEAAHDLPHMPDGHQCKRLHGHSYVVTVGVTGEVNPDTGFVIDFGELSEIVNPLINQLDHRYLNDIFDFPTTAENLAKWFYEIVSAYLSDLKVEISVYETATSKVIYPAT